MITVLLGLLLVACTEGPQVDVEAERDAVLAADRAWSETAPDVDGFVSYFTPSGILQVGGVPPAEGLGEIRSDISELFSAPGFALSWSASTADVSACGDLAYTVGSYRIRSNDPAGNPLTRPGKYLTVWKKQADGQWKVAVDAPSENQPPPPSPPAPFELAQDSVELDSEHYQVAFENDRVRVLRILYGPGEKSVMHEHPAGVAVFLTDNQSWRFALPDGTTEEETGKAGGVSWNDAVTHLPENLADQPTEVILVELKTK
jgi:ketosteroid isomerase-like protein